MSTREGLRVKIDCQQGNLHHLPASTEVLKPIRDGDYHDKKSKKAFRIDDILIRRGTQSVPANTREKSQITDRLRKQDYQLSIISGKPDEIEETLFSNLLEVKPLPRVLWIATVEKGVSTDILNFQYPYRAIYNWIDGDRIVTFDNLENRDSPLRKAVMLESIHKEELSKWVDDPDNQSLIIKLLNRELRYYSGSLGLLYDDVKNKFFYECDGDTKVIRWKSRYRTPPLTVAFRMYATQLNQYIYCHMATDARFTFIGKRLFLRISPTMLISEDGRTPRIGEKEGLIIGALTFNKYNDAYLNNTLFWMSRFSQEKESFALANGTVTIQGTPAYAKINVGIIADRPVSEVRSEVDEE